MALCPQRPSCPKGVVYLAGPGVFTKPRHLQLKAGEGGGSHIQARGPLDTTPSRPARPPLREWGDSGQPEWAAAPAA